MFAKKILCPFFWGQPDRSNDFYCKREGCGKHWVEHYGAVTQSRVSKKAKK